MLGQNFLTNENILKKISNFVTKNDSVIEIGSGDGRLSKFLIKAKKLILIEKDEKYYNFLKCRFNNLKNVEIILKDILKYKINNKIKWKIVGNIPYYITTPIIEKLIQNKSIESIYIMVASNFFNNSIKKRGRLGFWLNYCCDVKKLFNLSRYNFDPVPKVDSTFIKIIPKKYLNEKFKKFTEILFKNKRKNILNNLSFIIDKEKALHILQELNISFELRSESVDSEKLILLFNKINFLL